MIVLILGTDVEWPESRERTSIKREAERKLQRECEGSGEGAVGRSKKVRSRRK